MGVLSENAIIGASAAGGYDIDQSLRFEDGDSAYLSRTPSSAGNRKTWTWSGWVKRGAPDQRGFLFWSGTDISNNNDGIEFDGTQLRAFSYLSGSAVFNINSNAARFRDPSAWYHIVVCFNSTESTAGDRAKLYVNGERLTGVSETQASLNADCGFINTTTEHRIGNANGSHKWDGYLAEVHFIDGTALTPSSFGETDAATNQWKPIEYTGSYGTNGFYQKYSATELNTFIDSSSSAHTITANGDVTNTRAQYKVGDSSIKFDGTGDYLSVPSSSDFNFGSSDFTLEAWVKRSAVDSQHVLTGFSNGSGVIRAFFMDIDNDNTVRFIIREADLTSNTANSTGTIDTNWHHIAGVRDGNTLRIFIDGVADGTADVTGKSAADGTSVLGIGTIAGSASELNGYMDEIRISDVARYTTTFTPSTTAFVADSNTKLLIHSDFNGGLGADSSGNKNDFTPTNLVATDVVIDTPTNNFCTFNPLNGDSDIVGVLAEGNLRVGDGAGPGASGYNLFSTFAVSSGKWYYEYRDTSPSTRNSGVGWVDVNMPRDGSGSGAMNVTGSFWYSDTAYRNGMTASGGSMGATLDTNVIAGVALDADAGKIWFSHNGTWFDSQDPANGTNPKSTASSNPDTWMPIFQDGNDGSGTINYGQDSSFAGAVTAQGNGGTGEDFYYTPPTGFVALNTDNLSDPAIADPTKHFNTVLWSGDSSYPRSITGTGFATDLLWFKTRNQTYDNIVLDSVRGLGSGNDKAIVTNLTSAEGIDSGNFNVSSFDSGGFTMASPSSTDTQNASGDTYVGWNWKAGGTAVSNTDGTITSSVSANTTAGFSIVSYTGSGSAATIGHGLSSAPELIIVKARNTAGYDWLVYSDPVGNTKNLRLNLANGEQTNSVFWNDTSPTASVFSVGTGGDVNIAATTFIAYCFHSVEGYSKVGSSYTGNGSADGTFIYTGMKPAFLLVKNIPTAARQWFIFDSARDTYNTVVKKLYPNLTNAEADADAYDFVSNGFKVRSTDANWNTSGESYLYLAFAESPFKTSNARQERINSIKR